MILDIIAKHVIYITSKSKRCVGPSKEAIIEATKDTEPADTAELLRQASFFSALAGCTPGYFNAYGEAAYILDP